VLYAVKQAGDSDPFFKLGHNTLFEETKQLMPVFGIYFQPAFVNWEQNEATQKNYRVPRGQTTLFRKHIPASPCRGSAHAERAPIRQN
jgi:hypothetical protein